MVRVHNIGHLSIAAVNNQSGVMVLKLHLSRSIHYNEIETEVETGIREWNEKLRRELRSDSSMFRSSKDESLMRLCALGHPGFVRKERMICFKRGHSKPEGVYAAMEIMPDLVKALSHQRAYPCLWLGCSDGSNKDLLLTILTGKSISDSDELLRAFSSKLRRWLMKANVG